MTFYLQQCIFVHCRIYKKQSAQYIKLQGKHCCIPPSVNDNTCIEIKYRFRENYALLLFKITQFAMSMSSFNRRRFSCQSFFWWHLVAFIDHYTHLHKVDKHHLSYICHGKGKQQEVVVTMLLMEQDL